LNCIYDRLGEKTGQHATSGTSVAGGRQDSSAAATSEAESIERIRCRVEHSSEPAETRHRRMQELGLTHFYITETSPSIAFDKESSHDLFVKSIPRMAFKSDALLYSLYARAALHWIKTVGGESPSSQSSESMPSPLEQYRLYLELAFRYHREEMAQFSGGDVDLLLMTSHLMRIIAFVVLSERSLVPYSPPLEWLRITSSHAPIFCAAWDLVGDDDSAQVTRIMRSTPVLWDTSEREGVDKRWAFSTSSLRMLRRTWTWETLR
jgi:hypothetical protein